MKEYQGMKIIGIDNGYGNIKTANCCFPAGLTAHDVEPVFKDELLVYGGQDRGQRLLYPDPGGYRP